MIDEPQPEIVELERRGWLRGAVLDAGCGTGEHTLHLANLGYDVLGVDFSAEAIRQALDNAARRGIPARFEVADVLNLPGHARYDTVVDSALLHVFDEQDRQRYGQSLHAVCRPGALVHVLVLSDAEEGFGPRISQDAIRDAFTIGWEIEEIRPSRFVGIARAEAAESLGVEPGTPVTTAAWQVRIRRE